MKRKTSTAPTRIYTYGCRLPTEGAEIVEAQLHLARIYHNKLLEIELGRRAKIREAMATRPDVAAALAAVADLDKAIDTERTIIRAVKAAARSNVVDVKAQRARIRELQAQRFLARGTLKAAKEASKTPEMLTRFKEIQDEANAAIRAARAVCGVYWGTYLLCEQEIEAARKSKTDPQFCRWGGQGRIGVELIHGLPVAAVFGQNTRLQIAPLPTTGSKRGMTMTKVRIRVGSNADRSPVWAEFPFRLHRPLPADGVIKWAWIHRTFKGRWVNWDLQIVVEAHSFARAERPVHDGGVVAIDLGWRLRPGATTENANDLRIGYWYDDQGQHGEMRLDANIRQRLDHANSLRAIQDRAFDEVKAALLAWFSARTEPLSEALKLALTNVALWRSAKRLGAAIGVWTTARVDGDTEILERLTAWWKQHRHLYDWESCERDRTLNRRKDIYRNMAAQLTRKYAVVVLEDFDLREMAKHEKPESETKVGPAPTRRNRVVAAPAEFRLAIKSAAPGNGCRIIAVNCAYTTMKCHRCGHVEKWDAAASLRHTCSCGAEWDQDYNAAVNLLALFSSSEVPHACAPSENGENESEKAGCSKTVAEVGAAEHDFRGAVTIPVQEGMS